MPSTIIASSSFADLAGAEVGRDRGATGPGDQQGRGDRSGLRDHRQHRPPIR
jgi:hypothetical protein